MINPQELLAADYTDEVPDELFPDCDYFDDLRDDEFSPYPDGCSSCYRYDICLAYYLNKNKE